MTTNSNPLDFEAEVLNSPGSVLVDFHTADCGPCRVMAHVLQELAAERAGSLKIVKVDVSENAALASQFRVTAVPTFILFNNGQPQRQLSGSRSKRLFVEWLDGRG
jgi:thioredoxin 1